MSIDVRCGDKYALEQQLMWSNGKPIDLTQYSSVVFRAEKYGDPTTIITKDCIKKDAVNGIVSVNFNNTDLDVVGMYYIVWVLLDDVNDDQLTLPTQGRQWMHIQESIYPIE